MKKTLKTALSVALMLVPTLALAQADPFAAADSAIQEGISGFKPILYGLATIAIIGAAVAWQFGKVTLSVFGKIIAAVLIAALAPTIVEWISGFGD